MTLAETTEMLDFCDNSSDDENFTGEQLAAAAYTQRAVAATPVMETEDIISSHSQEDILHNAEFPHTPLHSEPQLTNSNQEHHQEPSVADKFSALQTEMGEISSCQKDILDKSEFLNEPLQSELQLTDSYQEQQEQSGVDEFSALEMGYWEVNSSQENMLRHSLYLMESPEPSLEFTGSSEEHQGQTCTSGTKSFLSSPLLKGELEMYSRKLSEIVEGPVGGRNLTAKDEDFELTTSLVDDNSLKHSGPTHSAQMPST